MNGNSHDIMSEISAILNGLIGGGRYGMKIRLPHAAVMTLLFRKDAKARDKLQIVLKSTFEHSRNLASFAALYKTILFLLKWLSYRLRNASLEYKKNLFFRVGQSIILFLVDGPNPGRRLVSRSPGLPEYPQHAAISGAIGGYFIWGKYSSINYQVVLYLMSRIISGMISLAREKGIPPFNWKICNFENVYPIKAAIVWGTVMALFESNPHVLHPSLKKSMDEVYRYENIHVNEK